jgi:hypothetical protein
LGALVIERRQRSHQDVGVASGRKARQQLVQTANCPGLDHLTHGLRELERGEQAPDDDAQLVNRLRLERPLRRVEDCVECPALCVDGGRDERFGTLFDGGIALIGHACFLALKKRYACADAAANQPRLAGRDRSVTAGKRFGVVSATGSDRPPCADIY